MKRKKSFLAGLCTLVLTASVAIGGFTYAPAAAATTDFELSDITVKSTVTYGENISVPAAAGYTVTVKTPSHKAKDNGTVVTGETITADELGNYIVTYTKGNKSYSFRVLCELDHELELFVENEAGVPSVVKTGDSKKLPGAYVGYYDEDGKVVKVDAAVTISAFDGSANGSETVAANSDHKFNTAGSTFVTYSAKVGSGTKHLSKTYEVKVQDNFSDNKAPSLSVSGVPSSANVNKAVTLPVATATDSFDERVEVVVTVKGKDASGNLVNVKKTTVKDETATAELEEDEVFDNDKNMTFYPVREGDYKVTYQAIDDSGNKSAEWTYTITCSDKKAPEITLDETKIPAKWGKTVYKYSETATDKKVALQDAAVGFEFPELTDNKDKADDLTVTFAIKDPAGKTVVNFSNINKASGESGTKYTNVATNVEYKFSKTDNFKFDFGKYVDAVKAANGENYQYYGDYVVTYTARDAAGNRATKTYTINVAETFEDTSDVTVDFKNAEKYVVASKDDEVEITLPAPTYTSTTDSKLTLTYTVANGEEGTEGVAKLNADVKGGEVAKIKKGADGYKLVYDNAELAITDKIVVTATAVSDAGNEGSYTHTIDVKTPGTSAMFGEVNLSGFANGTYDDTAKEVALGNIVIAGVADAKLVGVELGVKDENGDYMTVSAEVYAAENQKVIRNVTLYTMNKSGNYQVELRVFDINGKSKIYVVPVTVAHVDTDTDTGVASPINATSGNVYKKVLLANSEIKMGNAKSYLAGEKDTNYKFVLIHKVSGGRFALMGEEFTAMTTGNYTIEDRAGVVKKGSVAEDYTTVAAGKTEDDLKNYLDGLTQNGKYTVTDSSTVKFELQGVMPAYSKINGTVNLPKATAYTENANADDVVVDVKAPKGGKVEIKPSTEAGYEYSFVTTENGVYTVTYTVKAGNDSSTFTYTIKAGDVVAPTFTLTDKDGNAASHESTVKAGYKFSYLYVSATDNGGSEAANLTYTKKVVGPDGKEVGTAISGKGTTYANRTAPTSGEFTLDASGKYTVTYTVTDEAGNESKQEFEITVTNSTSNSGISLATLSTILIIVGVLLIAGVLVYLFRFRRVKKN